jgi:uncharacterized protein HemX
MRKGIIMELNETVAAVEEIGTVAEEAGEVVVSVGREVGKELAIAAGIAAVVVGLGAWGYKKWRKRGVVANRPNVAPTEKPTQDASAAAKTAREQLAEAKRALAEAEANAAKAESELRHQMEQAGI